MKKTSISDEKRLVRGEHYILLGARRRSIVTTSGTVVAPISASSF